MLSALIEEIFFHRYSGEQKHLALSGITCLA